MPSAHACRAAPLGRARFVVPRPAMTVEVVLAVQAESGHGDGMPPVLLPALFMSVCMAVAFSIGSSWGTYAVVFPLAMSLAWAVSPARTS